PTSRPLASPTPPTSTPSLHAALPIYRRVTGPAIAEAIVREGQSLVDTVTVGVGSGGTITGVGECVKAWTNDVRMVAEEPYECQADRKSTRLNSSHVSISYAVFCLKQK